MAIRLVTFDVLHTLITPRYPIHVQYARAFEPSLGRLDSQALKRSFRTALRQLQAEKPVYGDDSFSWWSAVIKRTALGAGAEPQALDASLSEIVTKLMATFSTKEGYKAFDDALPVLDTLHDELSVRVAVVSNADSRMISVLKDLAFPAHLDPILLSESEAVEKPSPEIFLRALQRVNVGLEKPITPSECVHVGDELDCDYRGAQNAGIHALLLERPGAESQPGRGSLDPAHIVKDMHEVVEWVKERL
ncbi:HAD hydrolase subfamily IA REG-2-like protein [Mycena belliarum]|uniref:HAD hydrolase subfamily IA REG-2-like protein n=1 Tax=Mycena belliarum TaxID=1033014 RepID=A0AAD6TT03_9AGAR|nr:HAD hydrolase subfamily IA REG-2-like protein [Mycena belliae]